MEEELKRSKASSPVGLGAQSAALALIQQQRLEEQLEAKRRTQERLRAAVDAKKRESEEAALRDARATEAAAKWEAEAAAARKESAAALRSKSLAAVAMASSGVLSDKQAAAAHVRAVKEEERKWVEKQEAERLRVIQERKEASKQRRLALGGGGGGGGQRSKRHISCFARCWAQLIS